jgi:hypothetical protein
VKMNILEDMKMTEMLLNTPKFNQEYPILSATSV